MNPVLKQRKTKIVSGWMLRKDGYVAIYGPSVGRDNLWTIKGNNWPRSYVQRSWTEEAFKRLYIGIPRKGRAVHVEIEIVVD